MKQAMDYREIITIEPDKMAASLASEVSGSRYTMSLITSRRA
jgi:hypothetical protein